MSAERIPLETLLGNNSAILSDVVAEIRKGAVFIYPTETIYGIGGIVSDSVEKRIYSVKKRPPENQLIIIAGSIEDFDCIKLEFPKAAVLLAKRFWPGNLTMVLKSAKLGRTAGVRLCPHPFLKTISPLLNQPMYSTSANISGEKYNPSPDVIYSTFCSSVDFMIDAGNLALSAPSSVVSFDSAGKVKVLREGVVLASDILKIVS